MDFINDIPHEEYIKYKNYYWLAVIGSRDYTDKKFININLDYLIKVLISKNVISNIKDLLIVSGKAKGVDRIAKQYADDNHILNINLLPDWNTFKLAAGMIRNKHIIRHSQRVIAFQYNGSAGTQNGIDHAKKMNIPVHVITI